MSLYKPTSGKSVKKPRPVARRCWARPRAYLREIGRETTAPCLSPLDRQPAYLREIGRETTAVLGSLSTTALAYIREIGRETTAGTADHTKQQIGRAHI